MNIGNKIKLRPINNINDSLVLASDFRCCNFYHVKRLSNLVVHCLARKSKSGKGLQVWIESVLEDIAPLYLKKKKTKTLLQTHAGFRWVMILF